MVHKRLIKAFFPRVSKRSIFWVGWVGPLRFSQGPEKGEFWNLRWKRSIEIHHFFVPHLPVSNIFGTKLPAANISGNDRPLVPNI